MSRIQVTGGGGGSVNFSFSIIQTDFGGPVVADGPTDTLTLTSSNGSVDITGNATTDTVNFTVDVSAVVGGSDTELQFNDAGAFGGMDALKWNKTTRVLTFDSFGGSPTPRFNIANAELNIDTSGSDNFVVLDINGTLVPSTTNLKVSSDHARMLIGGITDNTVSPLQAGGYSHVPSLEGYTSTNGPTFTLTPEMNVLYCEATTAVTFPVITAELDGKCFTVINGDGSGSTTVTFIPSGGDTIAGDFLSLSTRPYEGCKFMADFAGNRWRPVVTLPSDLFIGNTVVGGIQKGILFADDSSGLYLSSDANFIFDAAAQLLSVPAIELPGGSSLSWGTNAVTSPNLTNNGLNIAGPTGPAEGIVIGGSGKNANIEINGDTTEMWLSGLLWPNADGSAGQALLTDGSGNLSFGDAAGVITIGSPVGSGDPGSVLFIDGTGNLAQATGLTYDGTDIFQASNINTTGFAFTGGGEMDVVGHLYAVNFSISTSGSSGGAVEYTLPSVKATAANQVLTDVAADGVLTWETPDSGTIGGAISGATPNQLLYTNGSGNLANVVGYSDGTNLTLGSANAPTRTLSIDPTGGPDPFVSFNSAGTEFSAIGGASGVLPFIFYDAVLDENTLVQDTDGKFYAKYGMNVGSIGAAVHTLNTSNLGFFSVSPVAQQANIADPSGGIVQDAESRTAIAAILDLLEAYGLMAP